MVFRLESDMKNEQLTDRGDYSVDLVLEQLLNVRLHRGVSLDDANTPGLDCGIDDVIVVEAVGIAEKEDGLVALIGKEVEEDVVSDTL